MGAIQLDNTDLDGVFGPQPFYHSDEGRRLAGEMSKGGGDMSAEDEETMRAQFLLGWRSGNVSRLTLVRRAKLSFILFPGVQLCGILSCCH